MLEPFFDTCFDGKQSPIDNASVIKYHGCLPDEIIEFLEVGGLGSYWNGLLWGINPEEFEEVLVELYNPLKSPCVPFAMDAFGDLLLWESDSIIFINVRHGYSEVIGRKPSVFFNRKVTDHNFFTSLIRATNYLAIKEKHGSLEVGKCYGYFPLIATGGKEDVANIKVVNAIEHLNLISQFTGKIS